jgi:hypothetical protein
MQHELTAEWDSRLSGDLNGKPWSRTISELISCSQTCNVEPKASHSCVWKRLLSCAVSRRYLAVSRYMAVLHVIHMKVFTARVLGLIPCVTVISFSSPANDQDACKSCMNAIVSRDMHRIIMQTFPHISCAARVIGRNLRRCVALESQAVLSTKVCGVQRRAKQNIACRNEVIMS